MMLSESSTRRWSGPLGRGFQRIVLGWILVSLLSLLWDNTRVGTARTMAAAAAASTTTTTSKKCLYDTLGIDRKATAEQIKKAYRKQALRHHPDKGGNAETFKELSKAYEILSSPEQRKLYDLYGEAGIGGSTTNDNGHPFYGSTSPRQQRGNNGGGFSSFFGSSTRSRNGTTGKRQRHRQQQQQQQYSHQEQFTTPPGGGSFFEWDDLDINDLFGDAFGSAGSKKRHGPGGNPFGGANLFSDDNLGSGGGGAAIDLEDLLRHMNFNSGGGGGATTPRGGAAAATKSGGSRDGANHTRRKQPQHKDSQQADEKVFTREMPCTLEELTCGKTKTFKVKFNDDSTGGGSSSNTFVYKVDIQPGWKAGTKICFPRQVVTDENGNRKVRPAITFVVTEKKHPFLTRRGDDLVYRHHLSSSSASSKTEQQEDRDVSQDVVHLSIPLPNGEVFSRKVNLSDNPHIVPGSHLIFPGKGMPVRNKRQFPSSSSSTPRKSSTTITDRGNLIVEFVE